MTTTSTHDDSPLTSSSSSLFTSSVKSTKSYSSPTSPTSPASPISPTFDTAFWSSSTLSSSSSMISIPPSTSNFSSSTSPSTSSFMSSSLSLPHSYSLDSSSPSISPSPSLDSSLQALQLPLPTSPPRPRSQPSSSRPSPHASPKSSQTFPQSIKKSPGTAPSSPQLTPSKLLSQSSTQSQIIDTYHSLRIKNKNKYLTDNKKRGMMTRSLSEGSGLNLIRFIRKKRITRGSVSGGQFNINHWEIAQKPDPSHFLRDVSYKDFDYMDCLGKGAFGRVMRVRHRQSGKQFAMKVIDTKDKDLGLDRRKLEWEVNVLRSLDHPFVVKLFAAFYSHENRFLHLVMELIRGGTLHKIQKDRFFNEKKTKRQPVPEMAVKQYTAEILLALEHLHSQGYVYRDLKPDNLMIDDDGHIHLTDMGLVLKLDQVPTGGKERGGVVGAKGFKAPEMLHGRGYGQELDWWNLGIVMYMFLAGKHPFYKRYSVFGVDHLVKGHGQIKSIAHASREANDLLQRLLRKEPEHRLGAKGGAMVIKLHSFFSGIDFDKLTKNQIIRNEVRYRLEKNQITEKPKYESFRDCWRAFDLENPLKRIDLMMM